EASAIGVAASLSDSALSFAGGGASAVNEISGQSNAYATGSTLSANAASVTASNSATIEATVKATAVSVAVGNANAPAFAIGFAYAETHIGEDSALEVKAYLEDTQVTAPGGLTLSATSTSQIDATVEATAVAFSASLKSGAALTGAGLYVENTIASQVQAYI